jgi:hypothetical protein
MTLFAALSLPLQNSVCVAWVTSLLTSLFLSFPERNQNAQVICRYCTVGVVLTLDLALLVLLAMANYTASKTLSHSTLAMQSRTTYMVFLSVHILSATAAIIWTWIESDLSLRPLLVSG